MLNTKITFYRLRLESFIYLALGLVVLGVGILKFGENHLQDFVTITLGLAILSPLALYPQQIVVDEDKLIISYFLKKRVFTRREIDSIVLNKRKYRGGKSYALYIIPVNQKLISVANFNQANPIIYDALVAWQKNG